MVIDISLGCVDVHEDEVRSLYDSVGWSAYTADIDSLMTGLANSTRVVCARDGGALVGLARAISDEATIIYIQDILVDPAYHRQGIGRRLFTALIEDLPQVRQTVLLTDNDPAQRSFYESVGLVEIRDVPSSELRSYVRFGPF